jgi:hypothetical protein
MNVGSGVEEGWRLIGKAVPGSKLGSVHHLV